MIPLDGYQARDVEVLSFTGTAAQFAAHLATLTARTLIGGVETFPLDLYPEVRDDPAFIFVYALKKRQS